MPMGKGRDLCFTHDPDKADERKIAFRRGAEVSNRKQDAVGRKRLDHARGQSHAEYYATRERVLGQLGRITYDLEHDNITASEAQALVAVCRAASEIHKQAPQTSQRFKWKTRFGDNRKGGRKAVDGTDTSDQSPDAADATLAPRVGTTDPTQTPPKKANGASVEHDENTGERHITDIIEPSSEVEVDAEVTITGNASEVQKLTGVEADPTPLFPVGTTGNPIVVAREGGAPVDDNSPGQLSDAEDAT